MSYLPIIPPGSQRISCGPCRLGQRVLAQLWSATTGVLELERLKPTFKSCPDQDYDGIFELLPYIFGSVCIWVYGGDRGWNEQYLHFLEKILYINWKLITSLSMEILRNASINIYFHILSPLCLQLRSPVTHDLHGLLLQRGTFLLLSNLEFYFQFRELPPQK